MFLDQVNIVSLFRLLLRLLSVLVLPLMFVNNVFCLAFYLHANLFLFTAQLVLPFFLKGFFNLFQNYFPLLSIRIGIRLSRHFLNPVDWLQALNQTVRLYKNVTRFLPILCSLLWIHGLVLNGLFENFHEVCVKFPQIILQLLLMLLMICFSFHFFLLVWLKI